jgi:hypothetical protein
VFRLLLGLREAFGLKIIRQALSSFESMGPGSAFQPVIGDPVAEAKRTR